MFQFFDTHFQIVRDKVIRNEAHRHHKGPHLFLLSTDKDSNIFIFKRISKYDSDISMIIYLLFQRGEKHQCVH